MAMLCEDRQDINNFFKLKIRTYIHYNDRKSNLKLHISQESFSL